jgi:AbrB family looped-hinge helix DNA binding protein
MIKNSRKEFYGSTTVGKKGQIVIPVEARNMMRVKEGEKLLVFGMGNDMVAISKLADFERFASHMAERFEKIRKTIKKQK